LYPAAGGIALPVPTAAAYPVVGALADVEATAGLLLPGALAGELVGGAPAVAPTFVAPNGVVG
jgi:hypothetical protein